MVQALDSPGIEIRREGKSVYSNVESTPSFTAQRGIKIRVRIGGPKRKSAVPLGAPTNFKKLQQLEVLQKHERLLHEAERLRTEKEAARRRAAKARATLVQTKALLREQTERRADLEESLAQASALIQRLRAQLANTPTGSCHQLYRRVGLDEKCPEFVLMAVRKAYALELHPDRKPDHQKKAAEERLKVANATFDEIYKLRGLK
jgi:hypothetical protein